MTIGSLYLTPVSGLILFFFPDSWGEKQTNKTKLEEVRFFDLSKVCSSPVGGPELDLLSSHDHLGRECNVFSVGKSFHCDDDEEEDVGSSPTTQLWTLCTLSFNPHNNPLVACPSFTAEIIKVLF